MNLEKKGSINCNDYQEIILLLKTTGLIKDKSKQDQCHNEKGDFYFDK